MALSRTTTLGLVLLICVAAPVLAPPASAKGKGAETFKGTCEMSGVIRHDPPLTQTPATTIVRGTFRGVCTGQVTTRRGSKRRLDEAPATYTGRGVGDLSCLGGVARGTGRLGLGHGRVIDFSLTERRGPGTANVALEGRAGGTATVVGTVSKEEDLAELHQRCMSIGIRLLRGDSRIASSGISG